METNFIGIDDGVLIPTTFHLTSTDYEHTLTLRTTLGTELSCKSVNAGTGIIILDGGKNIIKTEFSGIYYYSSTISSHSNSVGLHGVATGARVRYYVENWFKAGTLQTNTMGADYPPTDTTWCGASPTDILGGNVQTSRISLNYHCYRDQLTASDRKGWHGDIVVCYRDPTDYYSASRYRGSFVCASAINESTVPTPYIRGLYQSGECSDVYFTVWEQAKSNARG